MQEEGHSILAERSLFKSSLVCGYFLIVSKSVLEHVVHWVGQLSVAGCPDVMSPGSLCWACQMLECMMQVDNGVGK